MKKFSVSKMLLALSAIALVPSACQQDEMPETVGGLPIVFIFLQMKRK